MSMTIFLGDDAVIVGEARTYVAAYLRELRRADIWHARRIARLFRTIRRMERMK